MTDYLLDNKLSLILTPTRKPDTRRILSRLEMLASWTKVTVNIISYTKDLFRIYWICIIRLSLAWSK